MTAREMEEMLIQKQEAEYAALDAIDNEPFSLEEEGEHVHCPKCGPMFVMDDSDLCRHLAMPLFRHQ